MHTEQGMYYTVLFFEVANRKIFKDNNKQFCNQIGKHSFAIFQSFVMLYHFSLCTI